MASTLATPAVLAAVRSLLVADATLAGTLATVPAALGGGPAIYAEGSVPQGSAFPYLTLGAPTEIPFDTMGTSDLLKFGSNTTFQVKALSKEMADDGNYARLARVKTLLDGVTLTVSGYASAFCEFESVVPPYIEVVGGVAIRQFPAIFRALVHQTV
jgi:hypothetical protein